MFVFKPGHIDPAAVPRYNYFIIPRAEVYLIIWLMDAGAVPRARCPAYPGLAGTERVAPYFLFRFSEHRPGETKQLF